MISKFKKKKPVKESFVAITDLVFTTLIQATSWYLKDQALNKS
jgi:hypothetical protein